MTRTDVLVIGAGQAGLAMSRTLADSGVDHVLLERGRVAERWRSERRPSLTLLTPNWMNRLPGDTRPLGDPDGFMAAPDLVARLDAYAARTAAPIVTGAAVTALEPAPGGGYVARSTAGDWRARAVVIATGACDAPCIPELAARLPADVAQIAAQDYRSPADVAAGGVLVVGASSSGLQVADELARAGREVTLCVGGHTRVPRTYRGRDVFWWLDRAGILDEPAEGRADIARLRRQPSFQLVGRPGRFDLGTARANGVRLVGRLLDVDGPRLSLAQDLAARMADADRRLARLLDRFDAAAPALGVDGAPESIAPLAAPDASPSLDLRAAGIRTVVWAIGYRRSYPWLRVPVRDSDGEIVHAAGITASPGLVVLGLRFMRARRSSFIDGCGRDAAALLPHILAHLGAARAAA